MPEENNDVNTEQVVTAEQDANTEQVVTVQDVNTDVVDQQSTDQAGETQDQAVPYERFKEVNDAKKAAEEGRLYAERQLELMQQNAQQPVQQTAPKTNSEQALENCSMTSEDLYGENIIKYQNEKDRLDSVQIQHAQAAMSTQQFSADNPDINEVVGSVNPATGQITAPTAELLALVQKKPYLAQASTSYIYKAVLEERELAEFKKNAAVQKEHLIRKGVEIETQPLGGSAAGGGGTGSQQGQQMLSREQTEQVLADIRAGKYS